MISISKESSTSKASKEENIFRLRVFLINWLWFSKSRIIILIKKYFRRGYMIGYSPLKQMCLQILNIVSFWSDKRINVLSVFGSFMHVSMTFRPEHSLKFALFHCGQEIFIGPISLPNSVLLFLSGITKAFHVAFYTIWLLTARDSLSFEYLGSVSLTKALTSTKLKSILNNKSVQSSIRQLCTYTCMRLEPWW